MFEVKLYVGKTEFTSRPVSMNVMFSILRESEEPITVKILLPWFSNADVDGWITCVHECNLLGTNEVILEELTNTLFAVCNYNFVIVAGVFMGLFRWSATKTLAYLSDTLSPIYANWNH